MKTIYRVRVALNRESLLINRSFIFGSKHEADAFLEDAKERFGWTNQGIGLDHIMTRKDALREIELLTKEI